MKTAGRPSLVAKATSRVEHEVLLADEHRPAWARPTRAEHRLPVVTAVAVAIAAQLLLPAKLGLHPRWLLPGVEVAALVVLTTLNPVRLTRVTHLSRLMSLLLVIAITVDNAISAILLDYDIVTGKASDDAAGLLRGGVTIYATNIIAFAIWYWNVDRGGPVARSHGASRRIDFLFPQMATPEAAAKDWEPRFLDYLYVSFTNATAFSPTDTMPLTRGVKALMTVQSTIALLTTGLVIARAVNVLK